MLGVGFELVGVVVDGHDGQERSWDPPPVLGGVGRLGDESVALSEAQCLVVVEGFDLDQWDPGAVSGACGAGWSWRSQHSRKAGFWCSAVSTVNASPSTASHASAATRSRRISSAGEAATYQNCILAKFAPQGRHGGVCDSDQGASDPPRKPTFQ